jgi:hypothetical protein
VLAELWARLDTLAFDYSGVRPSFQNGILRLDGVVADRFAKRQAAATARWLEGVIAVENELDTDASIVSRVSGALVASHRTEVAVVGVMEERGIVTLVGQVGDPNTREAAEEVARRQPGVVDVINSLEVRIEDPNELLRYRRMVMDPRAHPSSPDHRRPAQEPGRRPDHGG